MASVTIITAGADPRIVEITKPLVSIGRDPKCDIHLDNVAISKHHAEIATQGERYAIRDLQSSNKTFVNGKEITQAPLNDGDEISMGNFRLKFSAPVTFDAPPPPKSADDDFEPTLQLPPDMVRKKMEEMRMQQQNPAPPPPLPGGGGGGGFTPKTAGQMAAEASAQARSNAPAGAESGSNMLVVAFFVTSIVIVVVVCVLLFFKII